MKTIYKPESRHVLLSLILRFTVDPWILMLALGGLGHMLKLNWLLLSFWESLLLVIIIQSVSPSTVTRWEKVNE